MMKRVKIRYGSASSVGKLLRFDDTISFEDLIRLAIQKLDVEDPSDDVSQFRLMMGTDVEVETVEDIYDGDDLVLQRKGFPSQIISRSSSRTASSGSSQDYERFGNTCKTDESVVSSLSFEGNRENELKRGGQTERSAIATNQEIESSGNGTGSLIQTEISESDVDTEVATNTTRGRSIQGDRSERDNAIDQEIGSPGRGTSTKRNGSESSVAADQEIGPPGRGGYSQRERSDSNGSTNQEISSPARVGSTQTERPESNIDSNQKIGSPDKSGSEVWSDSNEQSGDIPPSNAHGNIFSPLGEQLCTQLNVETEDPRTPGQILRVNGRSIYVGASPGQLQRGYPLQKTKDSPSCSATTCTSDFDNSAAVESLILRESSSRLQNEDHSLQQGGNIESNEETYSSNQHINSRSASEQQETSSRNPSQGATSIVDEQFADAEIDEQSISGEVNKETYINEPFSGLATESGTAEIDEDASNANGAKGDGLAESAENEEMAAGNCSDEEHVDSDGSEEEAEEESEQETEEESEEEDANDDDDDNNDDNDSNKQDESANPWIPGFFSRSSVSRLFQGSDEDTDEDTDTEARSDDDECADKENKQPETEKPVNKGFLKRQKRRELKKGHYNLNVMSLVVEAAAASKLSAKKAAAFIIETRPKFTDETGTVIHAHRVGILWYQHKKHKAGIQKIHWPEASFELWRSEDKPFSSFICDDHGYRWFDKIYDAKMYACLSFLMKHPEQFGPSPALRSFLDIPDVEDQESLCMEFNESIASYGVFILPKNQVFAVGVRSHDGSTGYFLLDENRQRASEIHYRKAVGVARRRQFRGIASHVGPLHPGASDYKGSTYNLLVRWSNGRISHEPLDLFANEARVACRDYAKENGLLNTAGWTFLKVKKKPTKKSKNKNKDGNEKKKKKELGTKKRGTKKRGTKKRPNEGPAGKQPKKERDLEKGSGGNQSKKKRQHEGTAVNQSRKKPRPEPRGTAGQHSKKQRRSEPEGPTGQNPKKQRRPEPPSGRHQKKRKRGTQKQGEATADKISNKRPRRVPR